MEASFNYSYGISGGDMPPWAIVIWLAAVIFYIYCGWKIFVKAGQPGWAAIVPFDNIYISLKIVGKSGWTMLLFLIPFVNFVFAILVTHELSKRFGKGVGFTLGLLFLGPIFTPILALGDAKYTAPKKA
jgi:hypothetical protein